MIQEPEILYEDDDLIVCFKPAGIATQTKRIGQKDMESILRNRIALADRKAGRSGAAFIGVVHRLDQPVEGVMVFARTRKAASELSVQVRQRIIGKKYYALVKLPDERTAFADATGLPDKGMLRDYILADSKTNLSQIVPEGTKGAKEAKLDYCLLKEENGYALLDITLHTGRHHQIRAQLAHAGVPIAGDAKYGEGGEGGLALCSYHIGFSHPADGRNMEFEICPQNPKIMQYLSL